MPQNTAPRCPHPQPEHDGRTTCERKWRQALSYVSQLWRPSNVRETTHCTVSRYAMHLIDMATGAAYTAQQLISTGATAPMERTTEEGAPASDVYQTETITIGEFQTWPVNVHSMSWDGQAPIEFQSGSLAPAGAAALTAALKDNMLAQAAIAAEWDITSSGAVITMVRKTLGPLTGFSFTRTSGSALSVESVVEVAGSEGTPADALGQNCIVNSSDVYICTRLAPVKWVGPLNQ